MGSEERFALVTGAGVGIGKATARALARAGWHVALAGRRRDKLEDAARDVATAGRRALIAPCDVSDPQAVKGLFALIEKEFGRTRPPLQQRRRQRARRAARRTDL